MDAGPDTPPPSGRGSGPGKDGFRRRRFGDASRVLTLIGLALVLVPLLWGRDPGQPMTTSTAMIYLFGAWFGLAVLSGLLSARQGRDGHDPEDAARPEGPR